uniref:Uncharacterized protein n=1 Tax=Rhizophora mucronata TaxID=61149 RepID=A0A2P2PLL1_RHIMU
MVLVSFSVRTSLFFFVFLEVSSPPWKGQAH